VWDTGLASEPTISGVRSIFRKLRGEAQSPWWAKCSANLSKPYNKWELPYQVKPLPKLELPRTALHRLLAIRTAHGDFHWYHTKFNHTDANMLCSCGNRKTPEHLVCCRKAKTAFFHWPDRPPTPPTNRSEGIAYLSGLLDKPTEFAKLLGVTEFYSKICTR
jgi:hypothetical protein